MSKRPKTPSAHIAFHQVGICGVELRVPGYPVTSTGNLVTYKLVRKHAKAMAKVLDLAVSDAPQSDLKLAIEELKTLKDRIFQGDLDPESDEDDLVSYPSPWTSDDEDP